MGRLDRVESAARAVVLEMRREDVTFMAASIAYHAFVSMLPVLVLLVLVVSAFGSEEFVATVLGLTRSVLPSVGRGVVTDALRNARGDVGLSVVGVGVLLWGTSKVFRAMDAAFAEIYDTGRELSLTGQLRDALVVFLSLGVVAVGAVVLGAVVRVPPSIPYSEALGDLLGFAGLALAFLPMYSVFPNADVSLREAAPGVVVAAVGWVALERLFHLYVAVSNKPDVYGLIGTLLLLVTWLYAGSLVLLAGASVNATLAGRDGKREAKRRTKRQFGRRVADADSFARRLDGLVDRAGDAGVPEAEVRRALRRRAEEVGESEDDPKDESGGESRPDGPAAAETDADRERR